MCNNVSVVGMAYVTESSDEAAPVVLIVDNNPMSISRLSNIFRVKDFKVEVCEDGDKAVDEYIRLDPELVVLSLDIPSLDGHLAALEMREHGGECRIIFVTPARLAQVAQDAAYSAGAVAVLQKPVTSSVVDEAWDAILGTIPEAPGLADLDELYPEDRVKPEADEGPMPLPALPPLPGLPALPGLPGLPPLEVAPIQEATVEPEVVVQVAPAPVAKPAKKSKKLPLMLILIGIGGIGYFLYSEGLI